MKTLQELRQDKVKFVVDMEAITQKATTEARDMTEDESKQFDSLAQQAETIDVEIKKRMSAEQRVTRLAALKNTDGGSAVTVAAAGIKNQPGQTEQRIILPATAKKFGPIRNFRGENPDLKAYRFGMWSLAAMAGNQRATKYCQESGIPLVWRNDETRGQTEGSNVGGGYLVPEEFLNDMIDLRVSYGIFRANAKTIPMKGDTTSRMRRTGGLTAYFVGEAAAGTESSKTWDRVSLIAKKIMALTLVSSELDEDAVINIGDDLAGEIAYAFAYKEDICGFNGDGTSTYGGIVGARQRLLNVNTVAPTAGGGLILAAGNAYSEITPANLNSVVGVLPTYARRNAKWFCSPLFYNSVMERLLVAAGGNTMAQLIDGTLQRRILGYQVIETEVMPVAEANSQVCLLFGDLYLAADFGARRDITIAWSDSAVVGSVSTFETDQRAVRGTARFDINVHDVGTVSTAGPIVGLITAAS